MPSVSITSIMLLVVVLYQSTPATRATERKQEPCTRSTRHEARDMLPSSWTRCSSWVSVETAETPRMPPMHRRCVSWSCRLRRNDRPRCMPQALKGCTTRYHESDRGSLQ